MQQKQTTAQLCYPPIFAFVFIPKSANMHKSSETKVCASVDGRNPAPVKR